MGSGLSLLAPFDLSASPAPYSRQVQILPLFQKLKKGLAMMQVPFSVFEASSLFGCFLRHCQIHQVLDIFLQRLSAELGTFDEITAVKAIQGLHQENEFVRRYFRPGRSLNGAQDTFRRSANHRCERLFGEEINNRPWASTIAIESSNPDAIDAHNGRLAKGTKAGNGYLFNSALQRLREVSAISGSTNRNLPLTSSSLK